MVRRPPLSAVVRMPPLPVVVWMANGPSPGTMSDAKIMLAATSNKTSSNSCSNLMQADRGYGLSIGWYFYALELPYFYVAHDGAFSKVEATCHSTQDS